MRIEYLRFLQMSPTCRTLLIIIIENPHISKSDLIYELYKGKEPDSANGIVTRALTELRRVLKNVDWKLNSNQQNDKTHRYNIECVEKLPSSE